jgi:SAM-dependent methyltransferase
MNIFYTLAYWLGIKPWEDAAIKEHARIAALFDREEKERTAPFGRALDLGCGTGMHAVELARRGWQVTGVDMVGKAIRDARERARKARVEIRFLEGDVTKLRALDIGSDFALALDFGLFHGLNGEQRTAMAREVTAVTAPAATLLMIAWAPGSRGPLPRGVSRQEIEAAFAGWQILAEEALPVAALPFFLKNADPRIYRLRRGATPSTIESKTERWENPSKTKL